jgi:hypothetical protein
MTPQPSAGPVTSDQRWARWQAKGRRQDARLHRRARAVAIIGALAIVIAVVRAALLG